MFVWLFEIRTFVVKQLLDIILSTCVRRKSEDRKVFVIVYVTVISSKL